MAATDTMTPSAQSGAVDSTDGADHSLEPPTQTAPLASPVQPADASPSDPPEAQAGADVARDETAKADLDPSELLHASPTAPRGTDEPHAAPETTGAVPAAPPAPAPAPAEDSSPDQAPIKTPLTSQVLPAAIDSTQQETSVRPGTTSPTTQPDDGSSILSQVTSALPSLEPTHSGPRQAPSASGPAPQTQAAPAELEWDFKEINWLGQRRRILTQNANGPCSLIALANVLILRGDVTVSPPDRPVASFDYLSSLLAEHLLARAAARGAEAEADVAAALMALPSTQTGLAVNVRFGACDAFAPLAAGSNGSDEGGDGARALFQLAGVRLVHGWLPDAEDRPLLAAIQRAADYDSAMMLIAQADSLVSGSIFQPSPPTRLPGSPDDGPSGHDELGADQKRQVDDAVALKGFFDHSATQLTYSGLFALTQTLEPGELAAFFRNSHVSVIYHKRQTEGSLDAPLLYLLATDAALRDHEAVVWESLADVDQAASEFFDGSFCRVADAAHRSQEHSTGDVHARRRTHVATAGSGAGGRGTGATVPGDADAQLAQQLQEEEYGAAAATGPPPPTYSARPRSGEQASGTTASPLARASRPFRPQPPPARLDVPEPVSAPPRGEMGAPRPARSTKPARPRHTGPRGFGDKQCVLM